MSPHWLSAILQRWWFPAADSVTILLAVILPGNQFLPLASLAGMFYLFPLVLPITKRKCSKDVHHRTRCTDHRSLFRNRPRPYFTQAAHDVYEKTQDAAVNIPPALKAAHWICIQPLCLGHFPPDLLVEMDRLRYPCIICIVLMIMNRRAIIKYQKSIKIKS